MAGEYISEKHRDLVARYRQAEADSERNVWTERPDAANRIVVFDTSPQQD